VRIDRFDVYYVEMPMAYTWKTAYGEDSVSHSVLVKATSEDQSGWSEACPFFAPTYLNESAGGVYYHITEVFGPHVVGRDFDTAIDLNDRLNVFKGNSFAKAGIEVAWWTLRSSMENKPLHKLLGGKTREVDSGAAIGIEDSFDVLLGKVQEAVDAGFPRVKLKAAPGWDVDMLRAVRSAFPDIDLHIDCNAGYTLADLDTFKAIDDFNLVFIEQPLGWDDIVDHAELARHIQTPICLDESVTSPRVAEQAVRIGACEYINIKVWRSGGLANAVAIHDIAQDAGIPVWLGGMSESGLGKAIGIELATLPNFTYPNDLGSVAKMFNTNLTRDVPRIKSNLTYDPRLGTLPEPDPDRLAEMTRASMTISS